jgi:pimeloyl-ACP methyl ester carboxylesterase
MTPARRVLLATGSAVAAIGLLVAVDRGLRRRFGRPPRRDISPDADSLRDYQDVEIRAIDGSTLRGWLRKSTATEPVAAALIVHGWGGSAHDMLPVSDALIDLGLDTLLLDARGHGRSDDVAVSSMPAFADDLRAALRWMRTTDRVDAGRPVLVGHSVGAGACLFVAADDAGIAGVVSLASMADPRDLMAGLMGPRVPSPFARLAFLYIEHVIGHRFREFAPIYTIGRGHVPVLLLHGARDATVPVEDAYRLHARAPSTSTLVIVEEADHFSIEALDSARPELTEFLKEVRGPG